MELKIKRVTGVSLALILILSVLSGVAVSTIASETQMNTSDPITPSVGIKNTTNSSKVLFSPVENSKGKIALVVEESLYSSLEPKLLRHIQYLKRDRFNVELIKFSGTATELREELRELNGREKSLVGAKLVGDLPHVTFEIQQEDREGFPDHERFPTDLYFMDLNGNWTDTENDGHFDSWKGDNSLEIWVSRLKADNLNVLGNETEILKNYFDKNYAYRTGELRPEQKALSYIDDEWSHRRDDDEENLEKIYDDVSVKSDSESTTSADYINNALTRDQEMVLTRSHGESDVHRFYSEERAEEVNPSDYKEASPSALFYHLFVCSSSDYTQENYLAGTVALNKGNSGLLTWGSTKTGGMRFDDEFYSSLGEGDNFGEAFVDWFNEVKDFDMAPVWFYGMVLNGDAALRPSPFFEEKEPLEADKVSITSDDEELTNEEKSIDFSAKALDKYGNTIKKNDKEFTWTGADATGSLGKDEGGEYNVTASYQGVTSESVKVEVENVAEEYTIQKAIKGSGKIEVDGSVMELEQRESEKGEVLTIEAVSNGEQEFVKWSGDVPEEKKKSKRIEITMDSDKEITAHFENKEDKRQNLIYYALGISFAIVIPSKIIFTSIRKG